MDIRQFASQEHKLRAALDELISGMPDIAAVLEKHGVELGDEATLSFEVEPFKPKDPPDKCHTICVNVGVFKYCYRQCT